MASTGERGRHRLTEAEPAWPEDDRAEADGWPGAAGDWAGSAGDWDGGPGDWPDRADDWDDGVAVWTPGADSRADRADDRTDRTGADADTVVLPLPVVLLPEPASRRDGPATGLAKFDLGTIPASVTPPRSWRRAAWFSVSAAILVVVGLSFAAVVLMSAPRDPGQVDALPGLPSGEPLQPDVSTTATDREPNTVRENPTTSPAPSPGQRSRSAGPTASAPAGGPEDPADPADPPGPADPTVTARPSATASRPTSGPVEPSRTTVSGAALLSAQTDPGAMGDRTEQYFRKVVEDAAAAYALTSGSLRQAGPEAIEQRYASVERIEVTGIEIDPVRSTTRASLRVVGKDGSVTEMQRELTFSTGSNPKIIAERPVS
ncbi:hypothetical protein [Actinokineospora spheciospongiae]|uniref:hypothetical protein n=1 Tax=Actinokineospora spheciospongiae TaxID=909613 RepID=UPI000D719A70|nr:hypothetical protein [Actinokineospora spheciospongiae]PWW64400.1 hypothetical protein DFQ13_103374 [Actinokineospora spheciospongiae]